MDSLTKQIDHLSKHGAQSLARTIRTYWAKRGVEIETFVKSETLAGQEHPIFCVRSNLPGAFKEGTH